MPLLYNAAGHPKKMYQSPFEAEQKAGYNQSAIITDLLGHLLGSYIVNMNRNDLAGALEVIGRILDIVSAKVKDNEIAEVDALMQEIARELPEAIKTHYLDGSIYLSNPSKQKQLKIRMSVLFRKVNKLQDKYGYGMIDQADPRLAVLE